MSYDWFVSRRCRTERDVKVVTNPDPRRDREFDAVTSPYSRIQLLAQMLVSKDKPKAMTGGQRYPGREFGYWALLLNKGNASIAYKDDEITPAFANLVALGLGDPGDLAELLDPLLPFSVLLCCRVTLAKPYLSKDDDPFHICENPVRKDKVFKVPMVAPSSWKGRLRWMATHQLADWWYGERNNGRDIEEVRKELVQRRLALTRLFGDEKGVSLLEEEEAEAQEVYLDKLDEEAARRYRRELENIAPTGFRAGRLRCYPTFFDDIGLEVINPSERDKAAGKQPIYLESVPIGAKGTFSLLYVPFDLTAKPSSTVVAQMKEELALLMPAVRDVLLYYGVGAKVTDGFGIVEPEVEEGLLMIRHPAPTNEEEEGTEEKDSPRQVKWLKMPVQDLRTLPQDVANFIAEYLDGEVGR